MIVKFLKKILNYKIKLAIILVGLLDQSEIEPS